MSAPAVPKAAASRKLTAPMPQSQPTTRWLTFLCSPWGCTLMTGVMLWCAFFPLNWGWLGWVAMVPLLALCCPDVTQARGRRLYLPIWLMSLLFTLVMLEWIRLASTPMYAIWIVVALIVSWWYPAAVWMIRRLVGELKLPLLIAAPMVWVALEFFRAILYIGFAWYYLGHTQHEFLAVVQIADLFGAYGVSFLVMVVNVMVWEGMRFLWSTWKREDTTLPLKRFVLAGFFSALLLASTLIYGFWQLGRDVATPGPRLALVQGNVPQDLRNQGGEVLENDLQYALLGDEAVKAKPDLLVLPETCFSPWWDDVGPGVAPASLTEKQQRRVTLTQEWHEHFVKRWHGWMLVGWSSRFYEQEGERRFNSAILSDKEGKLQGRFDKMYLLPWGEFIPLEDKLPIFKWLSPYDHSYSLTSGDRLTVFTGPGARFAVLICYEDSVPHLAPQFMRQVQPPEYFINISNDGWFKGSQEHEQHMVAARFRAIENRRAVARCVNMGISGIIDGNGRVIALPNHATTWTDAKNCKAVVVANVPLDQRSSFYVQWGDVLPTLCWLFIFPGMVLALYRARREERRGPAAAAHPV